jgi:chaperonin GroEL
MIKKLNLSDESDVRERIANGIKKMEQLVGMTLGPNGRSVLIERGVGEPLIVDDGRRVAENIKLDDPIEQLAVRIAYGVTRKTDEKAGDGTTTSLIMTNAILQDINRNHIALGGIGAGANVNELDQKIQEAKIAVMEMLDKKTKKITTEKQLIDVATVSVGDPKLGEIIGKMYWKLGRDGHITIEFNLITEETETEVVPGYRFLGGRAASWMMNDILRGVWSAVDADVLIANHKITDFSELQPIANIVANKGKNYLVVVAKSFSESVIKWAFTNGTREKNPFLIVCVRAPGQVEEAFKDMAIFTGGKYFSPEEDLSSATKQDLGHVHSVEVSEDTCIFVEGKGSEKDVKKRIKEVQEEAKKQKVAQFKQSRLERASALSGGVGVIRIGAPTDEERNWLKHKIEDAKHATKHAFQNGVVAGGGKTLKEISEALPDDNILKQALLAPYEKLKANAAGKFSIPAYVVDPVVVEKAAIEHACSAVSKLIRIGGAVAMKPRPEVDESFKALLSNSEEHGE